MKRLLLALVLGLAAVSPAWSGAGTGPAPRAEHDLLDEVGFGDLAPEGLRFSSQPALGGFAHAIEAVLPPGAEAAQVRVAMAVGDPGRGWTPQERYDFTIPAERYRRLAAEFDAGFARGDTPADRLVVCTDGPGYLAERNRGGEAAWMTGWCGDHPNDRLSTLAWELFRERVPAKQ